MCIVSYDFSRKINASLCFSKRKREQVSVLGLSSWCLVIVVWFFLAMPWVCLQFVIGLFPDNTYLLLFVLLSPHLNRNSKFGR